MTHRSTAVRLVLGTLVATLALAIPLVFADAARAAGDEEGPNVGDARHNVDLEIGGGYMLGIESDTTIDDTIVYNLGVSIELNDAIDFEFGIGYAEGEAPDMVTFTVPAGDAIDTKKDLWMIGGGFRWYFMGERQDRVRPYWVLGYSVIDELKNELRSDNTSPTGFYSGPGIRMRAGDRSGFTIKLPLWFSMNGQTNTLLSPTLHYFFMF